MNSTLPPQSNTNTSTSSPSTQNSTIQATEDTWSWMERNTTLMKVWPPIVVVLGLVGNAWILVILRRMTSRPGSSSFHLFFIALAVTDILVLVLGLFPEWIAAVSGFHLASLNVGSCKITYWLAYSVELLSPWFLVAMTFQRAVTVVWPHHRHATCSRRQAHVTIVAMAAACLGLNSWVLYARTTTVSNGKVVCGWKPDYLNYGFPVVMWFNFALYSLIPYIIIAFSNTLLIRKVLRSARRTGTINRRPSMSKLPDDKHSRMTLTLITVSMVFVVLTFPTFIMDIVGSEMKDCSEIPECKFWSDFAWIMWFTNSGVNFYLYILTGSKFRAEVRNMIPKYRPSSTTSSTEADF